MGDKQKTKQIKVIQVIFIVMILMIGVSIITARFNNIISAGDFFIAMMIWLFGVMNTKLPE